MNGSDDAANRLRAASDNVLLVANELVALEEQKRHMAPIDPRFGPLASAVRRLAGELVRLASACEELGREIDEHAALAELGSIADTAPRGPLAAILGEWRSVERALESTEPGSAEADALISRFRALRAEYTHVAAQLVAQLRTTALADELT